MGHCYYFMLTHVACFCDYCYLIIQYLLISLLQVVNEPTDVHYPIMEMPTRAKLSCLSWSKHTKNHIASSDYEGIVTVWDVTTRQV